ncbi:MAG: DUF4419 domain-containing protein [Vulcanimicrobiota bacterium]
MPDLREFVHETFGLKLDLRALSQLRLGYRRFDFLPLRLSQRRLLLAVPEGARPRAEDMETVAWDYVQGQRVRLADQVDFLDVPPELFEKALWSHFGDCRPAPARRESQDINGRTFGVAAVEVAQEPLPTRTLWDECRLHYTEVLGVSDFYTPVLDLYEVPKASNNHLINAVYLAFAQHRPLVLSPDMIWVTLLQGLTDHFERNAESLRDKMVAHQGQKRLVVSRPDFVLESLENPWEEAFAAFCFSIDEHLKPEVAGFAQARFSTTGAVELAVFNIALMDMLKVYFTYEMNCVCGIPSITLEGTVEDWTQMRTAVVRWREFGLGNWIQALDPILGQFEAAARGESDRAFWNDIYQRHDPIDLGYGGPMEKMTGWLAKLFPYYGDQPNPALLEESPEEILAMGFRASASRASVRLQTLEGTREIEFVGGILGVEQRGLALRPRLAWVVHEERPRYIEDDLERAISCFRPELRKKVRKILEKNRS